MTEKMWGSEPFWGLGYEWDPDWVYTERQKELRATLIELCETELRAERQALRRRADVPPTATSRSSASTGSSR